MIRTLKGTKEDAENTPQESSHRSSRAVLLGTLDRPGRGCWFDRAVYVLSRPAVFVLMVLLVLTPTYVVIDVIDSSLKLIHRVSFSLSSRAEQTKRRDGRRSAEGFGAGNIFSIRTLR